MSEMKPTNFEEGIVDIVKAEEVVTEEVIVKVCIRLLDALPP